MGVHEADLETRFDSMDERYRGAHAVAPLFWNWAAIAQRDWQVVQVVEPKFRYVDIAEAACGVAERARAAYRPSWFAGLFGRSGSKSLDAALERAQGWRAIAADDDAAAKQRALEAATLAEREARDERRAWETGQRLAGAVLNRDRTAMRWLLEHVPFLLPHGAMDGEYPRVSFEVAEDEVTLRLTTGAFDAVPEQLDEGTRNDPKFTSVGLHRRNTCARDYACSLALRALRDAFALLPVHRVVLDVRRKENPDRDVFLAVRASRDEVARMNLRLTVVEILEDLEHRMDFGVRRGLRRIEPLSESFASGIASGPRAEGTMPARPPTGVWSDSYIGRQVGGAIPQGVDPSSCARWLAASRNAGWTPLPGLTSFGFTGDGSADLARDLANAASSAARRATEIAWQFADLVDAELARRLSGTALASARIDAARRAELLFSRLARQVEAHFHEGATAKGSTWEDIAIRESWSEYVADLVLSQQLVDLEQRLTADWSPLSLQLAACSHVDADPGLAREVLAATLRRFYESLARRVPSFFRSAVGGAAGTRTGET